MTTNQFVLWLFMPIYIYFEIIKGAVREVTIPVKNEKRNIVVCNRTELMLISFVFSPK